MKTRIISGGIGIVLLCIILLFRDTLALDISISIVNVIALYEILLVTKYVSFKPLFFCGAVYSLIMPFLYRFDSATLIVNVLYVMVLFITTIFNTKKVSPNQLAMTFTMSVLLTGAFTCLIALLRTDDNNGIFYFLLACNCAWVTDAGAYFVGSFFGKHKLAPEISPKKTIEGAVGGVGCGFLVALLICIIYQKYFTTGTVSVIIILVVTPIFSVMGMIGDLLASYIKRSCKIKDYGKILPGHGGVLDRFDSMLVTVPLFYLIISILPIINL